MADVFVDFYSVFLFVKLSKRRGKSPKDNFYKYRLCFLILISYLFGY